MSALLIAMIVGLTSTISPLLLAWLTGMQRRTERREEWRRQDEIAQRTNVKLDVIHNLVNSNLTQVMQSELSAHKSQLVLMDEVIDLKRRNGQEPSQDTLIIRNFMVSKIKDLEMTIVERIKIQDAMKG